MLDLNLEEVEDRYSSNNSEFRKLTTLSKLAPIEEINIIYITII